jgi:hypothetical protein
MPTRNVRMEEDEARSQIQDILGKLRESRSLGMETKAGDDNASVDYHIDTIFKAGGGSWNETIASDYIENLRAQTPQETEAPHTAM